MAQQCKAHARTGKQCGKPAIPGGTVCRFHGGGAPQVKEAARLRILALVDPALGTLARAVAKRTGVPGPTEIAAARDILDRAGLKEPDKIEISGTLSIADVLRARRQRRQEGKAE